MLSETNIFRKHWYEYHYGVSASNPQAQLMHTIHVLNSQQVILTPYRKMIQLEFHQCRVPGDGKRWIALACHIFEIRLFSAHRVAAKQSDLHTAKVRWKNNMTSNQRRPCFGATLSFEKIKTGLFLWPLQKDILPSLVKLIVFVRD